MAVRSCCGRCDRTKLVQTSLLSDPADTANGRAVRAGRSSRQAILLCIVAVGYLAVTALVLVLHSPLLSLDAYLRGLHLHAHDPAWQPVIYAYVLLGQRGPSTLAFLPYFCWLAYRQRCTRPLVLLGAALLTLNASVGAVKYGLGRIGPRHNADVHLYLPLLGTIYPSGHVSNAVVLYGLIAWTAPRWRKSLTAAAVFIAVTVGLGTIYLRTHWFSDVIGAWLAGALVLLALPVLYPACQRATDTMLTAARGWQRHARVRLGPRQRRTVDTAPAPPG